MDVRLVPGVPDQLVPGCVVDVMQRHGELGDAETGAEMPTLLGHDVDVTVAHRIDDLGQLVLVQRPEIGGIFDLIQ